MRELKESTCQLAGALILKKAPIIPAHIHASRQLIYGTNIRQIIKCTYDFLGGLIAFGPQNLIGVVAYEPLI